MTNVNELSSGAKAHKWDDSDTVSGTVVKVEQKQQTDIDTGDLRFWKNGDPMMQWVLTLSIAPATDDDDGRRIIYARGGKYEVAEGKGDAMLTAVMNAYRKAGVSEMEGALLTVKRTGKGVPATRGKNPPNLFSAKVEKGKTPIPPAAEADDLEPF